MQVLLVFDDSYRKDKLLFVTYVEEVLQRGPVSALSALEALDRMESESVSKARKGLDMALNDIVEATERWAYPAVAEFDSILRSKGGTTLSEMRVRRSRAYKALVRKGRIDRESDYYLAKGVLEGASESLSAESLISLRSMLVQYECRISEAQ
jgi:hypothetical protein